MHLRRIGTAIENNRRKHDGTYFQSPAVSFENLFSICRTSVFSGYFPAATSNHVRQQSEDYFKSFRQ